MNIGVIVICIVLMVLGASELVRLVSFHLMKPPESPAMTLVVMPGSAEECEYCLRAAAERIRWMDAPGACRLVCLDARDDAEIRKICRALRLHYPDLTLCKTENLVYTLLKQSTG